MMTLETGTPPPSRILVVEDENDIAALIAYQLTREGFRVETARTGAMALRSVGREVPDLIVLDRMLPEVSGDEVLRALKDDVSTRSIPVLFLTAMREQEHRVEGLELGADDYLTKPFSPRELVLRVQAILRRSGEAAPAGRGGILRAGPLRMDVGAHQVSLHREEVSLTPTEFRLLRALLERRGRTQSRKQLLEEAWDVEAEVSDRLHTRTVDMHVRRLRSKLGEVGDWVETVRGFGYRLKLPDGVE
ncbi:MAG: response regulator transcription factor [Gemmatimonadota bacterium]|nr:response regulator transcription factor [Gemmatimonadota bacterium]MDH5758730.1 response regulator transcription factor [Gemmatimonadota bacterium]